MKNDIAMVYTANTSDATLKKLDFLHLFVKITKSREQKFRDLSTPKKYIKT